MSRIAVVVPNWNGADNLAFCLDSLLKQSQPAMLIVIDNASTDNSLSVLEKYKDVKVIRHEKNKGYAGGVNPGLQLAIEENYDYVAAFNNDAVADEDWLKQLVKTLDENENVGMATCKLLRADGETIDSTGDYYTNWGLPYPRGRGETNIDKYDEDTDVFGASGGASLYRVSMLKQIGLFDETFFAYYEDVDLSFRAQLAGWKVKYCPKAVAYHQIGATSSKLKGFTTYQTMKNLPLLMMKNVPRKYLFRVVWRLRLAQILFFLRSLYRGQGWPAFKGSWMSIYLLKRALRARKQILATKTVSDEYIWGAIVHDLPPNAKALRSLRSKWWKLIGRSQ